MTRVDLGPSPLDSYPPARPEVLDAAMVIFGAAVAARIDDDASNPEEAIGITPGMIRGLRGWLEATTRQRLPDVLVEFRGGALVIAWVVG